MPSHVSAILWAQGRTLRNVRASEAGGRVLSLLLAAAWYGLWTMFAITIAVLLAESSNRRRLEVDLPWGLMLVFLYWQLAPIFTASLGAALDLKKLLVYPIPERQLFFIEVLLRLTTGAEMLLVTGGILAGLALNPGVPAWAPAAALLPFAVLNLFLAAASKSLLERLPAWRRLRELLILLLVLAAALPQLIAMFGVPDSVRRLASRAPGVLWPWSAAGRLAIGRDEAFSAALLTAWVAAAYALGRWQFHRGLRFDVQAAQATGAGSERSAGWTDRLLRMPSGLLHDPLGALVEKELRALVRSPRFRLVFVMGFSFGLLIWLPLLRIGRSSNALSDNFLTIVGIYSLMLLSEVAVWNIFGFDRAAAQLYFLAPVPLRRAFVGKNVATLALVLAEVTLVVGVTFLLRMPLTPRRVLEAYGVVLILSMYLLAAGNLSSVYYPRAVSPEQSWGRSASGKFHFLLLVIYPVIGLPVMLAYVARYTLASDLAFLAGLLLATALGLLIYHRALEGAAAAAWGRRERMVAALGSGAGPVVTQ